MIYIVVIVMRVTSYFLFFRINLEILPCNNFLSRIHKKTSNTLKFVKNLNQKNYRIIAQVTFSKFCYHAIVFLDCSTTSQESDDEHNDADDDDENGGRRELAVGKRQIVAVLGTNHSTDDDEGETTQEEEEVEEEGQIFDHRHLAW